jgi:hypothetical protein
MMSVDKRYNELFYGLNKRRAYQDQDTKILLTYRSSLLIGVLICINIYMNDLNASGVVRLLVTLLSFVQLTTLLEKKEEDQVSKILNPLFLVLGILLVLLYIVMKQNLI